MKTQSGTTKTGGNKTGGKQTFVTLAFKCRSMSISGDCPCPLKSWLTPPNYEPELLALSMRAWAPVFEKLKPAVPSYVYRAFYPQDWRVRQAFDIRAFLEAESQHAWIALEEGVVLGWVGVRLHPQDRMGEIYILAVDPDQQRRGVASALIGHAMAVMRQAGLEIVMVETSDDPGHAASRATYEHEGFQRWPVARYFREL